MSLRTTLACVAFGCLILPGLARAASQVAALDLGFTDFLQSTARDVNAAGQVVVEGVSVAFGTVPQRAIFLPPHPPGSVLLFSCYAGCGQIPFASWDRPSGITESGRIFGSRHVFDIAQPQFALPYPSSWAPPAYVRVEFAGVPGGSALYGQVRDMNDAGEGVGILITPGVPLTYVIPYYWSAPGAVPLALAHLGSPEGLLPIRINDAGAVIGELAGATQRAVYWSSPSAPAFIPLGELPGGATSHALDLDAGGRVVGSSDGGSGAQVAALWRPNGAAHAVVALPVPYPGGSCQEATAISEGGGLIAGNCTTAAGDRRGVIWRDDGASVVFVYELLPLAGADDSSVYGLGGSRLAAGSSGDPPTAVLWDLPIVPALPALSPPGLALLLIALAASFLLALRRRA